MNDLTVVILAAGLGTRMKSRKAKVLHEAGGLTLIEQVVNSALRLAAPERVIVVVGHQADEVRSRLSNRGVRFVEQKEQLGTGHALMTCRDAAGDTRGDLVLLYGDGPLLRAETVRRLVEQRHASGAAAMLITTLLDDPTGYGRALSDNQGCVRAIVEEKVASEEQRQVREINSGIYCFDAELLWKHLAEVQPNPVSKEYYLTDIVEILTAAGHEVRAMLHADATELLGINTRVELAEVDRIFRERKCRELMLAGVTIERPETVTIDSQVEIGMDSIVEPFARILGASRIGENCRIGPGAVLRSARLSNHVVIAPYTVIEDSVVEADVTIGPFARLRPGTHVHPTAHIGNFVELKNTNMGAGARAGHLAYLGDSEIGPDVNIGAGTITCNFDGAVKHRTNIGSGAFVGSNSTLVAPVQIGDGSYIAAGSVVTEPVPGDALAVGRSRQTVKEGWAKRRRERRQAKQGQSV
jgi:bifunctional UDP-N-acetylglucosamine pyrophosphorylase / glucosamine-1-phosphate N-acetyltransferase